MIEIAAICNPGTQPSLRRWTAASVPLVQGTPSLDEEPSGFLGGEGQILVPSSTSSLLARIRWSRSAGSTRVATTSDSDAWSVLQQ